MATVRESTIAVVPPGTPCLLWLAIREPTGWRVRQSHKEQPVATRVPYFFLAVNRFFLKCGNAHCHILPVCDKACDLWISVTARSQAVFWSTFFLQVMPRLLDA